MSSISHKIITEVMGMRTTPEGHWIEDATGVVQINKLDPTIFEDQAIGALEKWVAQDVDARSFQINFNDGEYRVEVFERLSSTLVDMTRVYDEDVTLPMAACKALVAFMAKKNA